MRAKVKRQKLDNNTKPERGPNGWFKKGSSGNPKGRGAGRTKIDELRDAIARVQTRKGKDWLEHLIERSYDDTPLAVAILARVYPTLKAIELVGAMNVGSLKDEECLEIQKILKQKYA
jgi:hypothetical protein